MPFYERSWVGLFPPNLLYCEARPDDKHHPLLATRLDEGRKCWKRLVANTPPTMSKVNLAEKQQECARHQEQLRLAEKANTGYGHIERKKTKKAYVWMYKQTHPCLDCGETDPVVLDFDHREPYLKAAAVSRLTCNDSRIELLINEIAKCDVRCSNCHRRKHHRERVAAL